MSFSSVESPRSMVEKRVLANAGVGDLWQGDDRVAPHLLRLKLNSQNTALSLSWCNPPDKSEEAAVRLHSQLSIGLGQSSCCWCPAAASDMRFVHGGRSMTKSMGPA